MAAHLTDTYPNSLSEETQNAFLDHIRSIQERKKQDNEFRDRLNAMDRAMRAFIEEKEDCKEIIKLLNFPLVMSQLDTALSQLVADWLSGDPIFPVVASPESKSLGSRIEAITDIHAKQGHWGREFMLFFRQLLKYNISSIEVEWKGTNAYSQIFDEFSAAPRNEPTIEYINAVHAPDMYNTLFDPRVDPPRISRDGEWAGYNELIPRQQLIREMRILQKENKLFNSEKALNQKSSWDTTHYWQHPVVSKYKKIDDDRGWRSWLPTPNMPDSGSGLYFRTKLYVRITPSDFSINSSEPSQIWKLTCVNGKILISAEPVVTFGDLIPMLFGQYSDDNIGIRYPSEVEYVSPLQEAASELLNNKVGSSKRSLGDRLLYRTDLVKGEHIKSKNPSARIPVDLKMAAAGSKLSDAVSPIPFTDPNSATVMQDIRLLASLPELITGNNSADEGQFRKGNRTLGEFNEIMQNSDSRAAMHPISLEEQVFRDLKSQIKFNLVTKLNSDVSELNPALGEVITLSPEEIRKGIMTFKFADGVKPKSLITNTPVWTMVWESLVTTGIVQEYDYKALIEYIASLGGVHQLERFRIEQPVSAGGQAARSTGQGVPGGGQPAQGTPSSEIPADQVPQ